MEKLFLVEGLERYLGASPRTVYRSFEASSVEEAINIIGKDSKDKRGDNIRHLDNKILFEQVELPK